MSQNRGKQRTVVYKETVTQTKRKKKKNGFLDNIQTFLNVLIVLGVLLAAYVAFFMPTGNGKGPTESNDVQNVTASSKGFSLYTYINEKTSANGKIEFDCTFDFDNNDRLKVQSSKDFKSKLGNSQIIGSTIYSMNSDSLVLDDKTYIRDGIRYEKGKSAYVQDANIKLDGGNLNLGKIEEILMKEDKMVSEDGVDCYKYTGSLMYGDMSNEFRNYIRNLNVNVSDIDNLNLNLSLFVTDSNLPYKFVVEFEDAKCMIKSKNLASKNCLAKGSLTISFVGFNNIETITFPEEIDSAKEGKYVFTDKLDKYLSQIGY